MNATPAAAHLSAHVRMENAASDAECAAIRFVNRAAFGGPEEAALVDKLRDGNHLLISLVAVLEARIVGHIMFSRMWVDVPSGPVSAVALAPMAVLPKHQRKGVGSLLIEHGLKLLRAREEAIVIVVGHPEYYPKFGFSSAQAKALESPFPREAFMALELREGALKGIEGSVVYPPAFGI